MNSKLTSPPQERRTKILVICMSCQLEYPSEVVVCSHCGLPTSQMMNCPTCNRLVSAKHTQCPYCAYEFVTISDVPLVYSQHKNGSRFAVQMMLRSTRLRAIVVSSIVFCTVFFLATKYGKLQHRMEVTQHNTLGYTYALRNVSLYSDQSLSRPSKTIITQNTVVEIVGFHIRGKSSDWIEVDPGQTSGYVRPYDFAPPKVVNEDIGYAMLQQYIQHMQDSKLTPLAENAVDFYNKQFDTSIHRDELLWALGEKLETLKFSRSTLADARSAEYNIYTQLSLHPGPYQSRAIRHLEQWKQENTNSRHVSASE